MKEIKKDLFECINDPFIKAICITTNSQFSEEGQALMTGGCALECAKRWPETSMRLGKCLKNFGTNIPFIIGTLDHKGNYVEPNLKMIKAEKYRCLIFSFPTIDNLIDGAKIDLIKRSAEEIKIFADRFQLMGVAMGRPGAGIGGLNWHKEVKPVLEKILDDRFTIVSFDYAEI